MSRNISVRNILAFITQLYTVYNVCNVPVFVIRKNNNVLAGNSHRRTDQRSYTEGLFACSRKLARRQHNPLRLTYARVDELALFSLARIPACRYLFIFLMQ